MTDLSKTRSSSPIPLDDCGLAAASDLLGDRWKLLILREIFYGVRRFADIHNDLSIPRSVLSGRLSALVDDGILWRKEYQEGSQRSRQEYHLTHKGGDLLVPLVALWQWASTHVEDKSSGLVLKQKSTQKPLYVGLAPRDSLVTASDITYDIEPASGDRPD